MMRKGFIVSSFAALAIALSSAVFADQNEGPAVDKEVKDPASDPAKQAKTEAMLKAQDPALSGDQGGVNPAEIKQPTPNAEAQAKTEKMLKDEKGALQGN